MPSMTMAATPLFLAIMVTLSPTTAVAENPSAAATITSPGWASTSAARMARLSSAPVWQVSAGPTNCAHVGVDRLDRMVERRAPLHGIDDVAGLRAFQLGRSARAAAARRLRRMVSSGGSLSIAFPFLLALDALPGDAAARACGEICRGSADRPSMTDHSPLPAQKDPRSTVPGRASCHSSSIASSTRS